MKTIHRKLSQLALRYVEMMFRQHVSHWSSRGYALTSRAHTRFVRWYVARHPELVTYSRRYLGQLNKKFQDGLDSSNMDVQEVMKIAFLLHILGGECSVARSVQRDMKLPEHVFDNPYRVRMMFVRHHYEFAPTRTSRVNYNVLVEEMADLASA